MEPQSKSLPILWFHLPYSIMVYGTSNGPQDDIGNYLGPCSMLLQEMESSVVAHDLSFLGLGFSVLGFGLRHFGVSLSVGGLMSSGS